jgi:hypothetical protein
MAIMTKWTAEPWHSRGGLVRAGDKIVAEAPRWSWHKTPNATRDADAARIVACVNALAGCADPTALPDLLAALLLLENMTSDDFSKGADRPIREAYDRLLGVPRLAP